MAHLKEPPLNMGPGSGAESAPGLSGPKGPAPSHRTASAGAQGSDRSRSEVQVVERGPDWPTLVHAAKTHGITLISANSSGAEGLGLTVVWRGGYSALLAALDAVLKGHPYLVLGRLEMRRVADGAEIECRATFHAVQPIAGRVR